MDPSYHRPDRHGSLETVRLPRDYSRLLRPASTSPGIAVASARALSLWVVIPSHLSAQTPRSRVENDGSGCLSLDVTGRVQGSRGADNSHRGTGQEGPERAGQGMFVLGCRSASWQLS